MPHGWHQQNQVMEMPRNSGVGVDKLLAKSAPRGGGSSSTTEALDGEKACWSYCTVTELQNNPHMLLSKRGGQPFPWKAGKCVSALPHMGRPAWTGS